MGGREEQKGKKEMKRKGKKISMNTPMYSKFESQWRGKFSNYGLLSKKQYFNHGISVTVKSSKFSCSSPNSES